LNKVVHLGYMHNVFDTRIFQKECKSLVNKTDMKIYFLTSTRNSSMTNGEIEGVNIYTIKLLKKRVWRLIVYLHDVKKKCREIDANIYHIHEPVLLPLISFFKKHGKKVIYDKHEDTYDDVKNQFAKRFGNKFGILIANLVVKYELHCISICDGYIYATPTNALPPNNKCMNYALIPNYPILDESNKMNIDKVPNKFSLCYAGGVSDLWSILEIVDILNKINDKDINFVVAGRSNDEYISAINRIDNNACFEYRGLVSFNEVSSLYLSGSIGMAVLKRRLGKLNECGTLANTKIFEYMQCGLPVIFTDFTIWKNIQLEYDFGIPVDPDNKEEIKNAILFLKNNPAIAKEKGEAGRRAIVEKYNWHNSEITFVNLYDKIMRGCRNE